MPEKVARAELEKVINLSGDFSKIVAKIAGYKTVRDYFVDASVTPRLKNIKIPTLFLSALDDPFFGQDVIPIDHTNENVLIAVTKTGGHLCYFTGLIFPSG